MKLAHDFPAMCLDPDTLLNKVNKVSKFMSNLNKMAAEQEGNGNGWSADDYKGAGFEALVECLFRTNETDKRLNVTEYVPNAEEDMGIDGFGYTNSLKNRKRVTVQAKYRSDVTQDLTTKDGISNFVANTKCNEDTKDADMIIVTTARGVNIAITERMYKDTVRVVAYKGLCELLDDNPAFWNTFRKALTER